MKTYNYFEAVKEDVKNYIENEIDIEKELSEAGDIDSLKDNLYDDLFCNDSVLPYDSLNTITLPLRFIQPA